MRAGLLVILSCVFVLVGCFEVDVVQVVHPDGTTMTTTQITTQTMDEAMCASMGVPEDECEGQFTNPCDQAPPRTGCAFDEATGTATYVIYDVLNETVFVRERSLLSTRYTLKELSTTDELEDWSEESEEGSLEMMQMFGLSATHTVVMPAPITSASVGIVDGNEVRINLLENPTNVLIIAEEENRTVLLAMAAFLGALILAIVAVLLIRAARQQKKEDAVLQHSPDEVKRGEVSGISKTEQKYRDYILQYKNVHSRKDIKSALLKAGISEQLANRYLDKYYGR